jgi:PAS domain S-box-containing protein
MMLLVFISEFAVMKMFAPLLEGFSPFYAGLVDSCLLVLLFSTPLWIFCNQLFDKTRSDNAQPFLRSNRVKLFCKLLAALGIVEFTIMILLLNFVPELKQDSLALLDASLTILFVGPFAWIVLSRYGSQLHSPSMTDLIGSPVMIYFALLYMVFFADTVQEALQPYLTPVEFERYFILIDSTLTTLIIAPFIWLLMGKPLLKAAQDEKSLAETILDQTVDAFVTLDTNGRILSINPSMEKIFGYTIDELLGQSLTMLFRDNPPDILTFLSDSVHKAIEHKSMRFKEKICKSRNGLILIMDISISSIRHHERDEWIMILHDISHHKYTEKIIREKDERFRQIFEQADDAIAFFKPESCKIIDINNTFAELFEYSKSEILREDLKCFIDPKDLSLVSRSIVQTGKGIPARLENFAGIRRNGKSFNLSMRSKLMSIDGVDIVFCSFRDITGRIRLETEAKEIQAKLIQTNKMTSLGLMVSGVAHEINNPNNFILSNSRLLSNIWEDTRKILNDYYKEHGDFCLGGVPFLELDKQYPLLLLGILDGSGRINEIINNLKKFYRQERTRQDLVDINDIAQSSVSLLHHELVKYTKNFHMDLLQELPRIRGSRQQIGQVIINLLMNACQSLLNKKNGIWLKTSYDRENSQVLLAVIDEGRGMTTEDSQKVMEPFFTTKLDEGGTGLGLAICRSIILDHNGKLEFETVLGKGSTFVVRLPAEMPNTKD